MKALTSIGRVSRGRTSWTKTAVVIREIVQAGHPALRRRAQPVDKDWIGTPEFDALVADMVDTMRAAPGVGLAAPQIGLSIQLIVVEDRIGTDDEESDEKLRVSVPLTVICNPRLKTYGKQNVELYEGCLSVAGFAAVTPRHRRARINFLNEKGEFVEFEWEGWPARILQHECDHLNGVLYIDHMDTTTFATTASLAGDDDEEEDYED